MHCSRRESVLALIRGGAGHEARSAAAVTGEALVVCIPIEACVAICVVKVSAGAICTVVFHLCSLRSCIYRFLLKLLFLVLLPHCFFHFWADSHVGKCPQLCHPSTFH